MNPYWPKFRFWTCLMLVAGGLYSCSPELETGKMYEVTSGFEEGIFVPQNEQGGRCSGVFYIDRGRRYAEVETVDVRRGLGRLEMKLPNGQKRAVTLQEYESPQFVDLPQVRLFTRPLYSVEDSLNVVYGHGRGFWSSYPCDYGESFLVTYGRKTLDLVFMDDDVELTMDIYFPTAGGRDPRPLFVMMHGGAFFNGDKQTEGCVAWCRHFASLGYVAASVNYRLGFRPTHNEIQRAGYRAVQDAHAAIRYLINQSAFNIDPELVFVAGTSAGAITALNVAFMSEGDRPSITKGGSMGDEGAIDAVSPENTGQFQVRAVGNMWGAIPHLSMLGDDRIPVISFHGEEDPLVPFKDGYPFQSDLLEIAGSFNPNRLFFDKMYGSYWIDRELKSLGVASELYSYQDRRHSLHLDEDGSLNDRFDFIRDKLTAFFSDHMESRPISLHLDGTDPQLIRIDTTHVNRCYWRIRGGVFRSLSGDQARILLFPGADTPSLTVQGDYLSGMTFEETLSF